MLEYVEGGSLSDIAKKYAPLPEKIVANYVKQVLHGLEYLHDQTVIHRDIKGANILAAKEGLVKLADFGVATKLSENEKINSTVGTPNWSTLALTLVAPEVINSCSATTSACDIWSLGCTILELLTGQPPYYKLNQMTAMYKIVNEGIPPLPDDVSPELKEFLENCFIRDPKKRKTAAELLCHPWVSLSAETNPKPNIELAESDQEGTAVPMGRVERGVRTHKHNSKEAHNTQMVIRNGRVERQRPGGGQPQRHNDPRGQRRVGQVQLAQQQPHLQRQKPAPQLQPQKQRAGPKPPH